MDDADVPGLIEYVSLYGVVDSPVNRKAYRVGWAMVLNYNRITDPDARYLFCIRVLWSETYQTWTAWVGYAMIETEHFVPMSMVAQTELLRPMGLQCQPECGDDCRVFVPTVPDDADSPAPDPEEVKVEFDRVMGALLQDSMAAPLVELEKLFPDNREGGEKP